MQTIIYLQMDKWLLGVCVFLPDAFRANPFKFFKLKFPTHTACNTNTCSMKPFLALVATNHETVVMRLSTDTPQSIRIIFILIRIRAITTWIVIVVIQILWILFFLACENVKGFFSLISSHRKHWKLYQTIFGFFIHFLRRRHDGIARFFFSQRIVLSLDWLFIRRRQTFDSGCFLH